MHTTALTLSNSVESQGQSLQHLVCLGVQLHPRTAPRGYYHGDPRQADEDGDVDENTCHRGAPEARDGRRSTGLDRADRVGIDKLCGFTGL